MLANEVCKGLWHYDIAEEYKMVFDEKPNQIQQVVLVLFELVHHSDVRDDCQWEPFQDQEPLDLLDFPIACKYPVQSFIKVYCLYILCG